MYVLRLSSHAIDMKFDQVMVPCRCLSYVCTIFRNCLMYLYSYIHIIIAHLYIFIHIPVVA